MKKNEHVILLLEEINKTILLLDDIENFYDEVQNNELKLIGRTRSTALIFAQIIENFYTCIETLFLKISQFFENSLESNKWQSDLLNKMTLRLANIRQEVISNDTYKNLEEIMRFRHFKRYYFELDYSWKKLDYIMSVYEVTREFIKTDLKCFTEFLNNLACKDKNK